MLVIEVRNTESNLCTAACPKTGGDSGLSCRHTAQMHRRLLSCRHTAQTHRKLMAELQAHCTDTQETDGSMNKSREF